MKTVTKLILMITLGLIIVPKITFGQNLTAKERAQYWTDWMQRELQISEDKVSEVHEINMLYAEKAELLKEEEGGRRSKFKALKAMDKDKSKDLEEVLAPEQYELYLKKKKAAQKAFLKKLKEQRG